jgi:hypothetical protein
MSSAGTMESYFITAHYSILIISTHGELISCDERRFDVTIFLMISELYDRKQTIEFLSSK